MDRIIHNTRRRFIASILAIIITTVLLSWASLQWYNAREIASPAHISEVHQTAADNQAFAAYLEEQKAYEAHFLTLASDIKAQEANRITNALTFVSIILVAIGAIGAFVLSKLLIKPVEEAYKSQERFIQDAAHELRNPLAAMTAALQQVPVSQRTSPLVATFRRQTKRLIHINEDLLFLERTTAHKIERISLNELLEDVVEELQPLARNKSVSLNVTTDEEMQKKMATTDYVRLVKNIIDNAIKYSSSGGSVSVVQRKHKNHIEITVADTGIGIPQSDQKHIGERFFRASNTGTIDGTGLGLAIVQKILNIYGGTKDIKSSPDTGTTVILRLPS